MNTAHLLLASFLATLLAACVTVGQAEPVPFRTLAKGSFSGIQEPKEELVKDKSKWEELWALHAKTIKPAPTPPEVDFSKEMVVFVTMGRQRTGGYKIEISRIETSQDTLKIYVTRTTPRPGGMAIQSLTAPFYIVAIPKSDLRAKFIDVSPSEKRE